MNRNRTYLFSMRHAFLIAISALILLCALVSYGVQPVRAADTASAEAPFTTPDLSRAWIQRLDIVEQLLAREKQLSKESRDVLKRMIDDTSGEANGALARDQKVIRPLRKELNSLGAAPKEGAPSEQPEIVGLRTRLQERVARVEARIQKARLILVRAGNLRTKLSLQETAAIQILLQRSPSLFERKTWQKAQTALRDLGAQVAAAPAEWWEGTKGSWRPARLALVVLAGLLAAVLAVPARRWLRRRYTRQDITEEGPTEAQRTRHATLVALAEIILPLAGLGALAAALYALSPSTSFFTVILINICIGGMVFFAITGLARAALAPADPRWRVLPVAEHSARHLNQLVRLISIYIAVFFVYYQTADFGGPPPAEFLAVSRLFTNTGYAALLLFLLPGRYWETSDKPGWRLGSAVIRGLIALCLLAVPILDISGYTALETFFLGRMLVTVFSIGAAMLLRSALNELLSDTLQPEGRFHGRVEHWLRLSEGSARLILFWCNFLVNLVIFGSLGYGLLVFYGLPADLLNLWLGKFATGFEIGNVSISLVEIVFAIVILVIGLTVTGWARRWISLRILANTRMEIGVRDSIASGFGYVGIVVAILVSIASLGLDLSKLALIASALSVGIGFGLRTVVENFIAGILLLIERPIQSGDWIIVGNHEGVVRRISVRSTEIQTFDRASVIVPNSELISQAVQNWTHRSRLVRLVVPVGVAYGSDTDKVREVLISCAHANETTLSFPEPQVIFRAFGDSSLNFELRCFVPDATQRIFVASELHFAIDSAFREAGIEIAFPQRDLHIRDLNLGETGDDTLADIETVTLTDTKSAQIGSDRNET